MRLKLNGTHQLIPYGDDISLLRDNIDTIKKYTKMLIDAGKEFSLEVNRKDNKYMLLSHHQHAVKSHDSKNPKCVLVFESVTSEMNTFSCPLFYTYGLHNK
jgi:hypothetical protein